MANRKKKSPLSEEEKRPINKKSFNSLLGIFKFILPYRLYFFSGLVFLMFSSTILLVIPYASGQLIDIASGEESPFFSSINMAAVILAFVLLAQGIASYFRVLLFAHVSQKSMADIRNELYAKYMQLPMSFHDNRRTGELTSRLTADITLLQDTLSTTLAEAFRQVLTLVVGLVIILVLTPKLSLFMLLTFPVIILVAMVFGRFIKKLSKKTQDKLGEANIWAEETISSIWTVKSYTGERLGIMKYADTLSDVVSIAIKTATYRAGFISFIIVAIFGGIVGVMWYGASLVSEGELLVGELISFILYTTFIGGSIAGLGDIYSQVQRAIGASERVLEILRLDNEVKTENDSDFKEGEIHFDNVKFAYPSRKESWVLNELSFKIEKNQKVAIVGQSGAGKTTIAQLLLHLYDIQHGEIRINNTSINNINLESLRKNIGVVPQDIVLFGGSIYENVLYGNPEASKSEVIEATKQANAFDFINEFTDGFNTMVGERGVKLSGGQRQRIAIARAILKNPKILILDEATSSLDSKSEQLVQEALKNIMQDRTTIVIAHRLSTIRSVDTILVMENGKIVERGTHEELFKNESGLYHRLASIQIEGTSV